jgi:hypothetical protein
MMDTKVKIVVWHSPTDVVTLRGSYTWETALHTIGWYGDSVKHVRIHGRWIDTKTGEQFNAIVRIYRFKGVHLDSKPYLNAKGV